MGHGWLQEFFASKYESRDQCVGQAILSSGDSSGQGMHPALTQLSAEPGFLCIGATGGRHSSDKTLVMVVVKDLGFWV